MNAPDSLRIPVFKFKWSEACSPHAAAIEQHVLEWMQDYQLTPESELRERTIRARYGWLAARCYPTAPLELLKTIADYIAWLFLIDDLCFDRVQTLSPRTISSMTAFLDVLDLNTLQPQPVFGERALLDICQRFRHQLGTERFQRFADGTRMMYGAAAMQALAHLHHEPVSARQYACIRRHGSGLIPCMTLIDSTLPIELKGKVQSCPEVEQLQHSTNVIVSLSNDIFSLNVELKQPGQHENMVTLMAQQKDQLQQGIDITAQLVREEIEHFTQLSEHLLISADFALRHYIQGLRYWLSGHQRWVEDDTKRYSVEYANCEADQRSIANAVQCNSNLAAS